MCPLIIKHGRKNLKPQKMHRTERFLVYLIRAFIVAGAMVYSLKIQVGLVIRFVCIAMHGYRMFLKKVLHKRNEKMQEKLKMI